MTVITDPRIHPTDRLKDQLLHTRSFDEDSAQHGAAYARYKQKMMQEFYDDDLEQDQDEDEDE